MHTYSDIDLRLEDKIHTTAMDHMYSRARIQKTSTEKQGMRIPERMLTDVVRNTKAFEEYDNAQRNNSVGLTTKKGKTAAKGTTKSKIVANSRTKKVTCQPKKKLTTIRDEPTDEEENVQGETETQELTMTKKKQAAKGKAKESLEETVTSPMSESEEEEQLQKKIRASKQSEEERISRLMKKGEGSGTQDVEMVNPVSEEG